MIKHLKYLSYVLRHKLFVLLAGLELGLPLSQLLLHDWTKFLPDEWFPYVEFFYGGKPVQTGENGYMHEASDTQATFDTAWVKHQNRNPHHWQYWIVAYDDGGNQCLEMPMKYVLEMIADWKGAGRAQGKPDTLKWYDANYHKIQLHPKTRALVDTILGYPQSHFGSLFTERIDG